MKEGTIYFVRRADRLVKIGFSTTPKARIRTLSKSHGPLEIIRTINGDPRREREIQSALLAHHEYGEWFRDAPEVTAFIHSLEEGPKVAFSKSDADRAWAEAEQATADEARELVKRLVKYRTDRTLETMGEAEKAVCRDYGLRYWTISHIIHRGAHTVSAHTLRAIRAALIQEMDAYRAELETEVMSLDEEREAAQLVARIAAKKARVAG